MTKQSIVRFSTLAAALLALPAMSWAGTVAEGKETKAVVEKAKESCITGDIGVNVVTQYISRGLVFENEGWIIQPYQDLYFKLFDTGDYKLSLNLGTWYSFHSRKTDAGAVSGGGGSSTRSWYEFDFTAGLAFTFLKNFTVTPSYFFFLSPNDGFSTFQGINVKFAYDDSDLLGKFALHPYVQVLFELENKAGNGPDEGIYYEVGIAPSYTVGPVTFTVPIVAGFGSNDFYAGNTFFGFASGGVNVAYAMSWMPECLGTWTANAGATYYRLGQGTRNFNPGIRDASPNEFVFQTGVAVAF